MTQVPVDSITKVPSHVAIIMDGNGRWANMRGLPRLAGHRAGTENVRRIVRACVDFGVKYLTVYAFSTENWERPQEEVQGLMDILESALDTEVEELKSEGVQIKHIGRLEAMPAVIRKKVLRSVEETHENHRLVLCVAWNYGGRDEIVCAVKQMLTDGVKPEDVSDSLVSRYLFTADLPDPDLIIRTSGEMRISNFLIWQSAYSEWIFTSTLWPDFDKEEFRKALIEYSHRDRRFGKLSECEEKPGDAD
jgi:undecaprenyl diphosphate synthase